MKKTIGSALYDMYENACQKLERYQLEKKNCDTPHRLDEEEFEMVKEWHETIDMIHNVFPHIKEQYRRNKQIQKSFTKEQIDFICWQIGDWYLIMKPLLEGQHNLGYMKERLKIMICGDEL